jgi:hypothetical protein
VLVHPIVMRRALPSVVFVARFSVPVRHHHPRRTHVFLNCPFDEDYENLFLALIAGLTGLGLTPRCVLEIPPGRSRLERLLRLIGQCSSSVHDLSRVELSPRRPRVPRFNMPFELGLAVALSLSGRKHQWYLMESKRYRLQASLRTASTPTYTVGHRPAFSPR